MEVSGVVWTLMRHHCQQAGIHSSKHADATWVSYQHDCLSWDRGLSRFFSRRGLSEAVSEMPWHTEVLVQHHFCSYGLGFSRQSSHPSTAWVGKHLSLLPALMPPALEKLRAIPRTGRMSRGKVRAIWCTKMNWYFKSMVVPISRFKCVAVHKVASSNNS